MTQASDIPAGFREVPASSVKTGDWVWINNPTASGRPFGPLRVGFDDNGHARLYTNDPTILKAVAYGFPETVLLMEGPVVIVDALSCNAVGATVLVYSDLPLKLLVFEPPISADGSPYVRAPLPLAQTPIGLNERANPYISADVYGRWEIVDNGTSAVEFHLSLSNELNAITVVSLLIRSKKPFRFCPPVTFVVSRDVLTFLKKHPDILDFEVSYD